MGTHCLPPTPYFLEQTPVFQIMSESTGYKQQLMGVYPNSLGDTKNAAPKSHFLNPTEVLMISPLFVRDLEIDVSAVIMR